MSNNGLEFIARLNRPALVGMIHVGALPGTPRSKKSVAELVRTAVDEAKILVDGGVDAIALENMHDVPYLNRHVGPEIVAAMTAVCLAVRGAVSLPLGIQVLAGANREAIAVAHASGCQFIRCEGFVFSHVADEGFMAEADAGPLLRYRRMIGAEQVAVIADIKKKHSSHAITGDVDLVETAKAAEFVGAEGVVITGKATSEPTDAAEVVTVRSAVSIPVFVGSGVTPENVATVAARADAVLVGSYLKRDGLWHNPPEAARVKKMAAAVAAMTKRG